MYPKGGALAAALSLLLAASCVNAYDNEEKGLLIYETLVLAGIREAYVDVSDERVLVLYNQPPLRSSDDIPSAWFYIIGASAKISSQSKNIVLVTAVDGEQVMRLTVRNGDAQDYIGGRIDEQTFSSRIKSEFIMRDTSCPLHSRESGQGCVCDAGYEMKNEVCIIKQPSGDVGFCCVLGVFTLPVLAISAAVLGAVAFILLKRRKKS